MSAAVEVHHGDCLAVLPMLAAGGLLADAVVTDPPYHLSSIVKRFGAPGAAPCGEGATGAYARASRRFMGKVWDGGDVAFRPETWAAVLACMKPGAHLVAFGGTRTYHRMACAIEDAGFEVRDQLAWVYGSGFPKSHDVAKGIDRALGATRAVVGAYDQSFRTAGGSAAAGWDRPSHDRAPAAIIVPASEEAAAWEGWGTAVKPAWEPIVLARKPLSESSIAANVLRWGTGALNIGACRVGTESTARMKRGGRGTFPHEDDAWVPKAVRVGSEAGRWPANVLHDGSAEVLAGFPATGAAGDHLRVRGPDGTVLRGVTGGSWEPGRTDAGGSAARYFYSAKAGPDDRLGSAHPTVKPVDLMRWLARLVTPPGGLVLDPFAGSGTTGMAAMREGFRAVLIEREAEYVADIRRRLAHVGGGDAPLFAGATA